MRRIGALAGLTAFGGSSALLGGCGGGGGESAAPDTTRPTVSSTSPLNSATGVTFNSSVSATFSEAMNNATLTTASFTLATTQGASPVTGMVDVNGNTVTF
ncbi:MAG: Ig-like domain-containing protein, partial [Burkholderiales bacterium]